MRNVQFCLSLLGNNTMYLKGDKNEAAEMSLFSVITLMWNLRVFLTDQMYFNRLLFLFEHS